MISDVLSDAAAEIRRYLADPVFADAYDDGARFRIDALLRHMDSVRVELDTLPQEGLMRIEVVRRLPPPPWRTGFRLLLRVGDRHIVASYVAGGTVLLFASDATGSEDSWVVLAGLNGPTEALREYGVSFDEIRAVVVKGIDTTTRTV